jgi:hypothetical protein
MVPIEATFKSLVAKYLDDFQDMYETARRTGQATPELSFRPALDKFFRELPQILGRDNVGIIYEPRKQLQSGRPDWRFHDTNSMAVYGYAEAKGFLPNRHVDQVSSLAGVAKYMSLGHRIVLTDGIDFAFFHPAAPQVPKLFSLLPKPVPQSGRWKEFVANIDILPMLVDFFRTPSTRHVSLNDLTREMALRAKLMAEDVMEIVRLEPGSGIDKGENATIEALRGLKELLEKGHDPDLCDADKFADMVSQVLAFGLMYAYWQLSPSVSDSKQLAANLERFWIEPADPVGTGSMRPFKALVESITSGSWQLGPLKTWYSDCILHLANTRLDPPRSDTPDYHTLYEQFLLSYDPVTRVDFGAYSTPMQLASYMVTFCDWIARARFDRPSLYESGNKIIDPCCGTGTFLEAVLCALPTRNVLRPPTIAGFEILAAPYALAQYRMTLLQAKGVFGADSVEVILCNTLSDPIVDSAVTDMPLSGPSSARLLLQAERNEAVNLSTPPITAVIGNPPSSDAGLHINRHTHSRILHLLEDFRPPTEHRTARQNVQKQMQNDFVKFLRWACHKLPESEPGILALVLPSSFLKNVSYATARKWLAEHFHWIWVVEFDQDGRTGVRTSNLFPTLQGRAVMFCARTRIGGPAAEVKYKSLLKNDRATKVSFFSNEAQIISSGSGNKADRDFTLVDVSSTQYKFQPRATYEKDLYESFWRLCTNSSQSTTGEKVIFLRHSSGVKLGITAALVHADDRILLRRTRAIGNLETTYETLVRDWFRGQKKPPPKSSLNPTIRQAIAEASAGNVGAQHISRYAFRPFCTLNAFLPTELLRKLSRAGGGGSRYRPELLAAYSSRGNFGIAVAPAPEDIGDALHRFSSFAWYLPDNDLCSRGNAHVFCLYYPDYLHAKDGNKWNSTPKLNISEELLHSMGGKRDDPELAARIVFYVYAILCSNAYLDRFEGVLYQTAGEWPRIPFPKDPKTFNSLANLGKQLAECERDDFATLHQTDTDILNSFPANEVDLREFEVDDKASIVIAIDSCGTKYRIPVPQRNILSCEMSGYRVVREWLKWRSGPYLRRKFGKEDAVLFALLVAAIQRQFELINAIDKQLSELLSDPSLLLSV